MNAQDQFATSLVDLANASLPDLGGRATPTTPFSDLEVDSLTCAELAAFLEYQYDIEIEDREVATARDFAELAELVASRMA